jgi:fumarate reductase flavoprotein subunit
MGNYSHGFKMRPEYADKCDARGMYITMLLTDHLLENENASLYLETWAESLLVHDGVIVGARCRSGEETFEIKAKAVVLATGGFAGSAELIEKYTSFHLNEDLFYTHAQDSASGDGLRMAWEVGAGRSHMMMDVYKGMPIFGGPAGTKNEWLLFSKPNLMVNRNGVRFIAEDCADRYAMGNAIHAQPGGCGFMIMDSTIADLYRAAGKFKGPDNATCLADVDEIYQEAQALDYPYIFRADSLEDLAAQTGINLDGLTRGIAAYNALCEAGEDTQFYKASEELRPILGPRYYAAQYFCDSFGGLGGIKIAPSTEVITESGEVIPGLFAAGSDVNSIYQDTYPQHLSGNTTGFAYTTGLMAANAAHDYLSEKENA